jgi:hypothetical protein
VRLERNSNVLGFGIAFYCGLLILKELMATSVTKGGTQKLPGPKILRLSKPTDMSIHWKALEEHFLMLSSVFRFNHIWGEKAFSEFFSKIPSLFRKLQKVMKLAQKWTDFENNGTT